MRLFELTGYKNHALYKSMKNLKPKVDANRGRAGETTEDAALISEFSKLGWKLIGTGAYGMVFGNNSKPYVLKVFKNDSRYLKYTRAMKQFAGNPHIPKIYGQGKAREINPDIYIVRVEKLEPIPKFDPIFEKYIDPELRDGHNSYEAVASGDNEYFLEEEHPLLLEVLRKFVSDDIHKDNVMRRGDVIVITDP